MAGSSSPSFKREVAMNSRSIASLCAAGFVAVALVASASGAKAYRPNGDLAVKASPHRLDTERRVSFADLNLAYRPGQRVLQGRIWRTANDLCDDLNGPYGTQECVTFALDSTHDQVAAAIERAQRQM